jgi:hypothetical protein
MPAQVLYLSISSFLDKRVEDEERKKYEAAQKARCAPPCNTILVHASMAWNTLPRLSDGCYQQ